VNATAAAAAAAAKAAAASVGGAEAASVPAAFATVNVPEKRIGIVIGPGGSKIKMIQEKTGAKIDTEGEMFTISGPSQGVKDAEQAVKDLVSKGYTQLAFEDFAENSVMVPGSNFPDLIGKGGCIVQAIKKELNVEVTFPPTSGTKGQDTKKYKVTIAGPNKGVEKCKEVINDIVNYGHHEVTHPGEAHEEIEVPEWCYAAIIGKKGCELRHLQNSYKVRAIIPRETSTIQNVVLVGETHMLPKAKAYVEKALYNFQNQVKGRDRSEGAAEDPWGNEEPMEDWMKQYMYKR
jgi:rRNA processing protein Krr1/Pno1